MRISVITPCYNSAKYLEETIKSVEMQRSPELDVEYIVLDAGSTDGSLEILERYSSSVSKIVREPDKGPADAINKGFTMATGEFLAWINADDFYAPGALLRACKALSGKNAPAMCFGHCPVVDESGAEIRKNITRFKELWYPFSCLPVLQMLNFVSQPATVFRADAVRAVGPLRLDLKAAWDYDFILRLWRRGGAVCIPDPPMASFRWTPGSISGSGFERQFEEELEVAQADAGRYAPQALLHRLVRFGIVTIYGMMTKRGRQ